MVVASPAYRRLIRRLAIVFVLFGVAMDVMILRYYTTSGGLFPGGRPFFAMSLFYWSVAALVLWVAVVLMLRFLIPAVMTDVQVHKVGGRGGA